MKFLNLIALLKFLVDNKQEILDFISEIKRLIDLLTKNQPVLITGSTAETEAIAKAMTQITESGQGFPEIEKAISSYSMTEAGAGFDFSELVRLLLENIDQIREAIELIVELVQALRN